MGNLLEIELKQETLSAPTPTKEAPVFLSGAQAMMECLLAESVDNIFGYPGGAIMPIYDALEHLIAITGLNMLLYFLERAKRVAGDDDPVEIICEIVSKERTKVRALSGDSYQFNQGLPAKAVRAHIESIRSDVGWAAADLYTWCQIRQHCDKLCS